MADTEIKDLGGMLGWDKVAEVPDNFFDDSPEDVAKGKGTDAASVIAAIEKDDEGTDQFKGKTNEEIADEIFADETVTDKGNQGGAGTEEEIEDEGDGTEGTEKKTVTPTSTVGALELLKAKGIVDYELEEGQTLTEEEAEDLVEEAFDDGVEARIEELIGSMPPIFKQMLKYAKDGGDVNVLLASAANQQSSGLNVNMSLETEANQEAVMREMFKQDGYDEEMIDTQIELLKDSNKLKTMAEKKFNVWKEKEGKAQEKLVEDQAKARAAEKETIRQNKLKLSTTLNEKDKVGDFTMTKIDKRDIPSYMFDKTVKAQGNQMISQYHADIFEGMRNETTALQLAILMRNRNKDGSFNMTKIKNQLTTQIAKGIKDDVRRTEQTPNKSLGSKGSQKKELHEYFN